MRVAPDGSLNISDDAVQGITVGLSEVVQLIAVDVQNSEYGAVLVHDRNNDLRASGRTAGDMTGELVDVRDDRRLPRTISRSADALIEVDPRAGNRSLKRSEDKLALLCDIETDPEKSTRLFEHRGDVREIRGNVAFTLDQRRDLRLDLSIDAFAAAAGCES